ncbi:MAG TPA: SDR family NAD(P)-dependent oxidoreductase [Kofleriaceae bacterium]|jgi:NAD(P)-dependent dehydrogenase (short-subunit alcohol dehydrogenase family)
MGLCDGRVALVTGGSRGLGRAICLTLAREGARVAFNYLRADAEAAATLAALEAAGARASAHKVSVLDRAGLVELVKQLDRAHGAIDILVNNAGYGQVVPLALMEEDDWDQMIDTHVKGAFLTTQAVLRTMVRQKYGRVINVSSLAGVKMMQAPVHYATAKAALRGFTEALAKEVGRYGITVNAIAPGILDEGVSEHLPPARKDEYLRHCALRRVGSLAEAAEVVAFLASERASYMNGATVVIDGGV